LSHSSLTLKWIKDTEDWTYMGRNQVSTGLLIKLSRIWSPKALSAIDPVSQILFKSLLWVFGMGNPAFVSN
jgi:hypothetical protein